MPRHIPEIDAETLTQLRNACEEIVKSAKKKLLALPPLIRNKDNEKFDAFLFQSNSSSFFSPIKTVTLSSSTTGLKRSASDELLPLQSPIKKTKSDTNPDTLPVSTQTNQYSSR